MSRRRRLLQAIEETFAAKPKARPKVRGLPSQNPLAVRMQQAAARPALPAPPKRLALPAPGPGLPPHAAKPRGGQFFTEKADPRLSPDVVARKQAEELAPNFYSTDELLADLETEATVPTPSTAQTVQDWLARSLAKYYKTDFGAPDDPLRDLAARGLHYDVDMTPERWAETVNEYLAEDNLQHLLFPKNPVGGMPGAGDDLRGETLAAMPWLAKAPATDNLYGIRGGLDLGHFADEFANALNPQASGIPADLAVRPESLARMSFPQAVERVGRINQFRAKQMAEQQAAALNNPAIQTFKEYPDVGFRWVELRAPDIGDELPEGYSVAPFGVGYDVRTPTGLLANFSNEAEALEAIRRDAPRKALQDALRFEGDTMGHCVGGYCDDVLSGRSRIFSLRDAKGQPHVTIETAPNRRVYSDVVRAVGDKQASEWLEQGLSLSDMVAAANLPKAEDIIQIKGKQNRAPVEDYIPYVQDFVKSGTWGNIGDFANTKLVKLPDGRFITESQYAEAMARARADLPPTADPYSMFTFNWGGLSPFFEGYAVGGRVSRDRCFSRHPMSVR